MNSNNVNALNCPPFLNGGGEMGQMIRSINWAEHILGNTNNWHPALKHTVSMMLMANFPILICWGNDYTQLYNDAFRPILGQTKHPQAMGISARETFAEIWDTIGPMFANVMNGQTIGFPNFMVPLNRNGYLEECYFDFSYSPIHDENGNTQGILVICMETTDKIRAIAELNLSQQNIRNMVRQSPVGMCIVRGKPLMVEEINDLFLEIIGKKRKQFEDAPYWVVNAEAAPYYEPITDRVLATGETYHADEHEIMLIRKGVPEIVHVDFVYEPIKNIKGMVDAIMIVAINVTEKVIARKSIEKTSSDLANLNEEITASNEELTSSNEELAAHQLLTKSLNEELAAINEELASSNEELIATNEELQITQDKMQGLIAELEASENKFRSLIKQAPVAINVFKTRDLIVDSINDKMLEIWNKTDDVNGKPFAVALPEIKGQPFLAILDDIFNTGKPYYGVENKAVIIKNGKPEERYFNFIYQPIKDERGVITSILQVVSEVTDQVQARIKLQKADEMTSMAIAAARLGSWHIDPATKALEYNTTLAELFGYEGEEKMTYDQAIAQVTDEYRPQILTEIEKAITDGGDYDITYTQKRFNDGEVIWLRSLGKVSQDSNGKFSIFSGFVMNITEQKKDEQRKNDFIGMVSHELKTPLTSLNAYVQMLQGKAQKNKDSFTVGALEKARKQVNKMTTMINGFLNVSRLESGKIHIDKQLFDMAELIKEVEEESLVTISSHQIIFAPVEPAFVMADKDKIGQVISNLISNATKYSAPDSIIHVACIGINNTVQVSVRDEGIGINAQDLERLFDRYYRVESTNTISGFGIGLYLSAEIIARHDGQIWVESDLDKGSIFYFSLPSAG
jgi:two-component system sensor histidine kinase VicK